MVGLNMADPDHPLVDTIASFARDCGTAFQLQDDILGIVGDERTLGKPVGSDIREGKRTTIVLQAYRHADEADKDRLNAVLGNVQASEEEIRRAIQLLRHLGGVDYTANLAKTYVARALDRLDNIPPSKYRDLLHFWADFMIQRTF